MKNDNLTFELYGADANTVISSLIKFAMAHPDAKLVIRQCAGTDFPPFLSIETPECFDRWNADGNYPICY